MGDQTLILLVGPTAVGKTKICLNLAKFFKTEIISCDSRQFYTELDRGTAKPDPKELAQIKHHMINSISIFDAYDVRRFEADALSILEELFKKHSIVLMTGGSGLFAKAISDGLDDMPEVDPTFRQSVIEDYHQKGLACIQDEVQQKDPDYFAQVDQQNPQRLMRALEVIRATGKPFSFFRKGKKADRPFRILKIGLQRDRNELYERIDRRMDEMIAQGLFEEATRFFAHRHLNALQTVGYQEIFGYLEGRYDREEAIRLLKRNSRRYAKRQLTWFAKDPEIHWFHPDQEEAILAWIQTQIL